MARHKLVSTFIGVVSLFADEADGAEMNAMVQIINSLKIKANGAK